jgi:NitT/TauT family transport system substrate-binding protein
VRRRDAGRHLPRWELRPEMIEVTMKRLCIGGILVVTFVLAPLQSRAADTPFRIGLAGNPPVFMAVQEYVAAEEGFFKKYGVDVQLRNFANGGVAADALAHGEIDLAATPTPVVIASVATSKAGFVGIYGLENTDWLIGSIDDSIKTCHDLIGKAVGIDAPGGGRWTALQEMTGPPPCNLKMEQMQLTANGTNSSAALIAGRVKVAVLHLDDISEVEDMLGRPLLTVMTLKRVRPISHYDLLIGRPDRLTQDRERFVRVLAGLIDAEAFMRNAKNWDRVAQIAAPTGRSPSAAKASLKKYLEFEFWPNGHDGLDQRKIEAEINAYASRGDRGHGDAPPSYDSLVDRGLFKDAMALTQQSR